MLLRHVDEDSGNQNVHRLAVSGKVNIPGKHSSVVDTLKPISDLPKLRVPERVCRKDSSEATDTLLALKALIFWETSVEILLYLLGRRSDSAGVVLEDLAIDTLVCEAKICRGERTWRMRC